MKNKATKFATVGAVAALLATSAFAAPQSDSGRWDRNRNQETQQTERRQPQADRSYQREATRSYRNN